MEECRQEWLSRPREEPPTDQAAAQAGHSATASHAGQRTVGLNLAAAPWENAGNPLLARCARPRCGSCGITLKTGELACPFCVCHAPGSNEPPGAPGSNEPPGAPGSNEPPGAQGSSDASPASDGGAAELRRKRRKVQMRLVSLRRGDVRPRPGEPESLEKIVAELDAVALRLRGWDGKFATKS